MRQFYTLYEQKFSNTRPLHSITISQGFGKFKFFGNWTLGSEGKKTFKQSEQMKKKMPFFAAAILHPLRAKVFKYETPSFHYISPRIPKILKVWILNFEKWGKNTVKRSEKRRYQKILLSKAKFAKKQFFCCTAILHPLLEKLFKSETTFSLLFPKDFESLKILDIQLWEVGAKRRLKRYIKKWTDTRTDRRTDL